MSSRFLLVSILILIILSISIPYIKSAQSERQRSGIDEYDLDEAEINDLLELDEAAAEYEVDDADYDIDEADYDIDDASYYDVDSVNADDLSNIGYDGKKHRRSGPTVVAGAVPNIDPNLLDQLKSHNTLSSCWSVLNGAVYDLTNFRHSGGQNKISSVCGGDMTNKLHGKHGTRYDSFFANRRVA